MGCGLDGKPCFLIRKVHDNRLDPQLLPMYTPMSLGAV